MDGTTSRTKVMVHFRRLDGHGSAALKEQYLDRYAEVFAAAGLASIVYDHRNFGASDGDVRQEIDPILQMRDYRHAVTFAMTLPGVNPEKIGAWGTSLSGGHVLMLAAVIGGLDASLLRCRRSAAAQGHYGVHTRGSDGGVAHTF